MQRRLRTVKPADDQPLQPITGVVIGRIAAMQAGQAMVTHAFADSPQPALLMTQSETLSVGDEVALLFQNGDPARPLLIGRLQVQHPNAILPADLQITGDHERVAISHPRHLTLTCGKASISLTADGRIHLSGEYLLSVAKGLNRIAGASVKLN